MGRAEPRSNKIMKIWAGELEMKSGGSKREASCPSPKLRCYDSCLRPNLRPTHSADSRLRLQQPSRTAPHLFFTLFFPSSSLGGNDFLITLRFWISYIAPIATNPPAEREADHYWLFCNTISRQAAATTAAASLSQLLSD